MNSEWRRNSAKLVFVATPEMPEMETCAPRVPSRNSRLKKTGAPSRPSPTGTFASIWSKYSAWSRTAPGCAERVVAGARRDVALRVDAGGGDLGDLLDLAGQDAVGDQEDVGAERGALVAGDDVGDDPGGDDRADARDVAGAGDDVVELEVGVLGDRDVELQRRRVRGAGDLADDGLHVPGGNGRCLRGWVDVGHGGV